MPSSEMWMRLRLAEREHQRLKQACAAVGRDAPERKRLVERTGVQELLHERPVRHVVVPQVEPGVRHREAVLKRRHGPQQRDRRRVDQRRPPREQADHQAAPQWRSCRRWLCRRRRAPRHRNQASSSGPAAAQIKIAGTVTRCTHASRPNAARVTAIPTAPSKAHPRRRRSPSDMLEDPAPGHE